MSRLTRLPDEILFLIVRECIPRFESIQIKWREERLGPHRRRSRSHPAGRRLPWRAFDVYGLPDITNLKLVSTSINKITDSCLRGEFGGGLELSALHEHFDRLLPLHDAKLEWIIPRVTHLSFPIHFRELDCLNALVATGVSLPALTSMHMEWQMRITAWHATSEDAEGGQLHEYVKQVVMEDRWRGVGIARYFDDLREIFGKRNQFKLTAGYIIELSGSNPLYHCTLDVSTEETVIIACERLATVM